MTHPLAHLAPYLARYRLKIAFGFLAVCLTVAASLFSPWILKHVIDDLQSAVVLEKLPVYAGLIVGASLLEGVFRFLMRRTLIGVSRRVEYDLRNDFLQRIQATSLSRLQSRSTGDIMSRATSDLGAVRMVLGPGIMYSMHTVILTVAGTVILVRLDWLLTLLSYIPLVLVTITVRSFGRRIHDRFSGIQAQFSALSTKIQENLSGIRVVKAYAQEDSEVEAFGELNREYVRRNVSLIRLLGVFYPLLTVLIGLSFVALLWYGGALVIERQLTLGEFVAFMGYLGMLAWPTKAIGRVINIFQRGSASMGRILELMQAPPEAPRGGGARRPSNVRGDLEIRNLTFRYDGAPHPVLHAIDLTVPAGTTLAIVGPVGSGKSTLVHLIPRLFDPPPGTVFLDGADVLEWPLSELRRHIGYVPQETFLFSDTIRENIGFGLPGGIPDATLEWAASVAHIAGDVQSLPRKMQTYVGERGVTLSGGQKQRVAISRALAIRPEILIFDDSLSSVDTYTEERILEQLARVMKGRTTIWASHRISTIQHAHWIVVLEEGRIAEQGTHASLTEAGGLYAQLYKKQLLEKELDVT